MSMNFHHAERLFLRFHFSILRGASFLEYLLAIMSIMAVLLFCICALRFRKKIG